MSTLLPIPGELVVATHNPDKLRELAALLGDLPLTLRAAGDLGLDEPAETGTTFAENARIKAEAAARGTALPALADDSGLEVFGLGGRPGVHSARWAGSNKDFVAAMRRVVAELSDTFGDFDRADRRAAFVCVLCLVRPDGALHFFEGRTEGEIVAQPRGAGGFGYDPIFRPEGATLTFGEMSAAEKQALSHRARAFARFRDALPAS